MKGILKMEKSNLDYVDSFLEEIVGVDFFDMEDLFKNRELIRKNYQSLTKDYKRVYKWYFYFKLCLIKNPLKDLMWSYIVGCDGSESELISEYIGFISKKRAIIEKQKGEYSEID